MEEKSFSLLLRNLANDYYHGHIGFADYRAQRKIILDRIDHEINGKAPAPNQQEDPEQDSMFMRTIGFFKNRESP